MRSRTVLRAGLAVAGLALGAPAVAQEPDVTPPAPQAVPEAAVPGDQHTQVDLGFITGTLEGATGYVLTLDAGDAPLVQLVVKDEEDVRIVQEGRPPLALSELEEGMPVRAYFRNEGEVRVVTYVEVLVPAGQ